MSDRDPFALDDVEAERRRVQEDVREVVVEQVDLVDVEDAAVRLGQEPGLERLHALTEGAGDVEIGVPREPRPRVLALVEADEGTGSPPEACPFEAIARELALEDRRCVDDERRDRRRALPVGVGLDLYVTA